MKRGRQAKQATMFPTWAKYAGLGAGIAVDLRGPKIVDRLNETLAAQGSGYDVSLEDANVVDGVLYAEESEKNSDRFEAYWLAATELDLPMVRW